MSQVNERVAQFRRFVSKCGYTDLPTRGCKHPRNEGTMARSCNDTLCPIFTFDKVARNSVEGGAYTEDCMFARPASPGGRIKSCVHSESTRAVCSRSNCPYEKYNKTLIKEEKDRNGVDQHAPGAKLDGGKIQAGVLGDFGLALLAVAKVGTGGLHKYTRGGWQKVDEAIERYDDALWRHNLKRRYCKDDPDMGMSHMAHLAWNILAELELQIREEIGFSDDTPVDSDAIERWMSQLPTQIHELERKKKERQNG